MAESSLRGIVAALKNIKKGVNHLDPVLVSVNEKVSVVRGVTNSVFTLVHNVDICCNAISTLKKVASALSGIPIIGTIASIISRILEVAATAANVIKTTLGRLDGILKKVDGLLKKAQGGLDELSKCNRMVGDHVPEFIKTIQIIDYVVQLARIVEPIVIGDDMRKRLSDMLVHLEKIERTASVPIDELNKFITEIGEIINSVKAECDSIREKTRGLTDAISNISIAVSILKPVGDALNAIINAIAPIKWVLQAAACLIDKILKPVIDAILRVTGLQKLIDKLSGKLKDLLGINSIVEIIENQFAPPRLSEQLAVVGDAFGTITLKWNVFSDSLADFSPLRGVDMKGKMKELLLSVFNGVVDPSKPSPIPDWPDEPDLSAKSMEWAELGPRFPKINWEMPLLPDERVDMVFFSEIDLRHPEARELDREVEKTKDVAKQIYPSLDGYRAGFTVLRRTVDLPSWFLNETEMLKTYLGFMRDLVLFLSKLPKVKKFSKERLERILQFIGRQIADLSSIERSVDVLQKNLNEMVARQDVLTSQLPTEMTLDEMLVRIGSWPVSLDHLLDGYDIGAERYPGEQQLERLRVLDSSVKNDASALSTITDDIATTARNMIGGFATLSSDIARGIDAMKGFSPQGYLFPEKYLDKMEQAAKVLHQLDAVFEPLLMLIEVLRDKEERAADNSILNVCQNLIIGLTNKLEMQADKVDWLEIVEAVLEHLSPISNLLIELDAMNSELDTLTVRLDKNSQTLVCDIRTFTRLIETEKSYKFHGEDVGNRFLEQVQVDEAESLAREIANAS